MEQKGSKFSLILRAPLVMVVNERYLHSAAWVTVWGALFHFESYLMMVARKHAYSIGGATTVTVAGALLELMYSMVFAVIATAAERILSQFRKRPPEYQGISFSEWWLIYAAANVHPALMMILVILFFQGNVNWLFGGVLFFNSFLLIYYSYLRASTAGAIVALLAIVAGRTLQVFVLAALAVTFKMFTGW